MEIKVGHHVRFLDSDPEIPGVIARVTEVLPNLAFTNVHTGEVYNMPWQDLGDVGDDVPTYEGYEDVFSRLGTPAIEFYLDDLTCDDPDNEVSHMQTMLQAIHQKLGQWREAAARVPLSVADREKIEAVDQRILQLHNELDGLMSWNGNFGKQGGLIE